ncbi:hypothetical protein RsoM2USA_70 [Ralstonia phage RsoM2USA]|nr:hypothetical protein RsoM2USA_70 [Ralstonia phage RsoM2USA]
MARKPDPQSLINRAVSIRLEITDHYHEYEELKRLFAWLFNDDKKHLKTIVDGLYYLGGGWPTENTQGRLESMLDSFVKCYKYYHLIGKSDIINKYLEPHGIEISLTRTVDSSDIDDTDAKYLMKEHSIFATFKNTENRRDVMMEIVERCMELQGQICEKADIIKLDIKKKMKSNFGLDAPEFGRLVDIEKLKRVRKPEKVRSKIENIHTSQDSFNSLL